MVYCITFRAVQIPGTLQLLEYHLDIQQMPAFYRKLYTHCLHCKVKSSTSSEHQNSEDIATSIERERYYLIVENIVIQFSNCFSTSFCQSLSTDDVKTKCFSSRLMRGIGKFSCTVSLSAIMISLQDVKPGIHDTRTSTTINIQFT